MKLSRREWWALAGAPMASLGLWRLLSPPPGGDSIPFVGEQESALDVPTGDELDGRLFTDLSRINGPDYSVPAERFYIRTRASKRLGADRWRLRYGGTGVTKTLAIEDLLKSNHIQSCVMECAGNGPGARFGMIGATAWKGVLVSTLLDSLEIGGNRILIEGFDEYEAAPSLPSIPGASWVFSRDDLCQSGALLATGIGSDLLTADHGGPLRLVVPGWYGCCCIKWVNRIRAVDDDIESTSQMREYSARTMQIGVPRLARDFVPSTIAAAAIPVRIERDSARRGQYRVHGIVWGIETNHFPLQIRFSPEEPFAYVNRIYPGRRNSWGFWTHLWRPPQAGIFSIEFQFEGFTGRNRLSSGQYTRQVFIDGI